MTMELDHSCDVSVRGDSVIVHVKGFAVFICKTESGVLVDVYARGRECCETLGRCHVSDALAQRERDEGL